MGSTVRLALAAALAVYLTYDGATIAVRLASKRHWASFALAVAAGGFFAICMCFLLWRFARRFAKPS